MGKTKEKVPEGNRVLLALANDQFGFKKKDGEKNRNRRGIKS
jgi:hypothetical protein